ncbi:MAG: MBL fold metallo-hydrolase [Actinomycetota bacterium]
MIVEGFTSGVFQSNTYVLAAAAGQSAVVVDPGQDAAGTVAERLAEHGLRLEAVLLTHGHVDHIWSAKEVCDAAGVPAFIHPADRYLMDDPAAALGAMGFGDFKIEAPADIRDLADADELNFGGLRLQVRHTPGHTPGHCVFVADGLVMTGDLIFQGSIGRTDFPGGSLPELMDSIRRAVMSLDDDVAILSGHGPATSVGVERRHNPFVLADARGELNDMLGM